MENEYLNSQQKSKYSKKSKSTKGSHGSMDSDPFFLKDYTWIKEISEGTYSQVFKLQHNEDHCFYALKVNKGIYSNPGENDRLPGLPKDLITEIGIMQELDAKYIVKALKNFYIKE